MSDIVYTKDKWHLSSMRIVVNRQLSKKEAVAIYDSKEWEAWDAEEIVKLQLFQDRLCVPFGVFHKAVGEVLGRPVWTHEFAFADRLREEYLKERAKPTFEDIVNLVPPDKLIVVAI